MKEHMANGIIVANFLESSPLVDKVVSPALSSHPQHSVVLKQQYGHSGMVTFYLKGMLIVKIITPVITRQLCLLHLIYY